MREFVHHPAFGLALTWCRSCHDGLRAPRPSLERRTFEPVPGTAHADEDSALAALPVVGMAKAGHGVIVDHADGLHERIDDRRSDKLETALLQIFRQGARNIGFRRSAILELEVIDNRGAVDKAPD